MYFSATNSYWQPLFLGYRLKERLPPVLLALTNIHRSDRQLLLQILRCPPESLIILTVPAQDYPLYKLLFDWPAETLSPEHCFHFLDGEGVTLPSPLRKRLTRANSQWKKVWQKEREFEAPYPQLVPVNFSFFAGRWILLSSDGTNGETHFTYKGTLPTETLPRLFPRPVRGSLLQQAINKGNQKARLPREDTPFFAVDHSTLTKPSLALINRSTNRSCPCPPVLLERILSALRVAVPHTAIARPFKSEPHFRTRGVRGVSGSLRATASETVPGTTTPHFQYTSARPHPPVLPPSPSVVERYRPIPMALGASTSFTELRSIPDARMPSHTIPRTTAAAAEEGNEEKSEEPDSMACTYHAIPQERLPVGPDLTVLEEETSFTQDAIKANFEVFSSQFMRPHRTYPVDVWMFEAAHFEEVLAVAQREDTVARSRAAVLEVMTGMTVTLSLDLPSGFTACNLEGGQEPLQCEGEGLDYTTMLTPQCGEIIWRGGRQRVRANRACGYRRSHYD